MEKYGNDKNDFLQTQRIGQLIIRQKVTASKLQVTPTKLQVTRSKFTVKFSIWGRLYERWISYPMDKFYPMNKSPIQWIAIHRIKMRCTKLG